MKDSAGRLEKYRKKIRALVLPSQVPLYNASLPDRARLEMIVKSLGITPMLAFSYLAYAEQLLKIKKTHKRQIGANEADVITFKWQDRGLLRTHLNAIATSLGYSISWPPCPSANFGEENLLAIWLIPQADRVHGVDFVCPSAGTVQSITVYCRNTAGVAHNMKLAVYVDNAGTPGARIAYTNSVSIPPGFTGWRTVSVVGSPAIPAGSCFLMFWPDNTNINIGRTNTAHNTGFHNIAYGAWPDPFPGWTPFAFFTYCLYCTYVPDVC